MGLAIIPVYKSCRYLVTGNRSGGRYMKHVIPGILAGLLLLIGGLLLGGNSFAADVSASSITRDGSATTASSF